MIRHIYHIGYVTGTLFERGCTNCLIVFENIDGNVILGTDKPVSARIYYLNSDSSDRLRNASKTLFNELQSTRYVFDIIQKKLGKHYTWRIQNGEHQNPYPGLNKFTKIKPYLSTLEKDKETIEGYLKNTFGISLKE